MLLPEDQLSDFHLKLVLSEELTKKDLYYPVSTFTANNATSTYCYAIERNKLNDVVKVVSKYMNELKTYPRYRDVIESAKKYRTGKTIAIVLSYALLLYYTDTVPITNTTYYFSQLLDEESQNIYNRLVNGVPTESESLFDDFDDPDNTGFLNDLNTNNIQETNETNEIPIQANQTEDDELNLLENVSITPSSEPEFTLNKQTDEEHAIFLQTEQNNNNLDMNQNVVDSLLGITPQDNQTDIIFNTEPEPEEESSLGHDEFNMETDAETSFIEGDIDIMEAQTPESTNLLDMNEQEIKVTKSQLPTERAQVNSSNKIYNMMNVLAYCKQNNIPISYDSTTDTITFK